MMLIKTTDELQAFLKKAQKAPFITIDTEFMSEKRFWPQLCLIQIGIEDEAVAIDPLSNDLDLSALKPLLVNEEVLKVFHAGRQDMAIFLHLFKALPRPVYDTQIAAMVCGFGENVGYQRLVQDLTRGDIEKSSRFTDWSQRPLSSAQLKYALNDVIYLREIYLKLQERIKSQGRQGWIEEETAWLTDPATYALHPENAWLRLRLRNPKPKMMLYAQALAAWREERAQREDIPRPRVLKDDALLDLATQTPQTPEEMSRLRSIPKGFERSSAGREILEVIKSATNTPREQWPKIEKERSNGNDTSAVVDLLKVLLKHVSEEHHVAPKLLASIDDLKAFAAGDENVHFLKGWRGQIFGDLAIKLRNGDISITLNGNKIAFSG